MNSSQIQNNFEEISNFSEISVCETVEEFNSELKNQVELIENNHKIINSIKNFPQLISNLNKLYLYKPDCDTYPKAEVYWKEISSIALDSTQAIKNINSNLQLYLDFYFQMCKNLFNFEKAIVENKNNDSLENIILNNGYNFLCCSETVNQILKYFEDMTSIERLNDLGRIFDCLIQEVSPKSMIELIQEIKNKQETLEKLELDIENLYLKNESIDKIFREKLDQEGILEESKLKIEFWKENINRQEKNKEDLKNELKLFENNSSLKEKELRERADLIRVNIEQRLRNEQTYYHSYYNSLTQNYNAHRKHIEDDIKHNEYRLANVKPRRVETHHVRWFLSFVERWTTVHYEDTGEADVIRRHIDSLRNNLNTCNKSYTDNISTLNADHNQRISQLNYELSSSSRSTSDSIDCLKKTLLAKHEDIKRQINECDIFISSHQMKINDGESLIDKCQKNILILNQTKEKLQTERDKCVDNKKIDIKKLTDELTTLNENSKNIIEIKGLNDLQHGINLVETINEFNILLHHTFDFMNTGANYFKILKSNLTHSIKLIDQLAVPLNEGTLLEDIFKNEKLKNSCEIIERLLLDDEIFSLEQLLNWACDDLKDSEDFHHVEQVFKDNKLPQNEKFVIKRLLRNMKTSHDQEIKKINLMSIIENIKCYLSVKEFSKLKN
jgi:hypothetical protein